MNYYFNYKMKIAYLISVYKDPQQFVRMLKALRGKETYFFIHVDAKVDDKIFIDNLPIDLLPYVIFTSKRYYIQWGGFNQVLYQKELYTHVYILKFALKEFSFLPDKTILCGVMKKSFVN